jgi:hypothetical protein
MLSWTTEDCISGLLTKFGDGLLIYVEVLRGQVVLVRQRTTKHPDIVSLARISGRAYKRGAMSERTLRATGTLV